MQQPQFVNNNNGDVVSVPFLLFPSLFSSFLSPFSFLPLSLSLLLSLFHCRVLVVVYCLDSIVHRLKKSVAISLDEL